MLKQSSGETPGQRVHAVSIVGMLMGVPMAMPIFLSMHNCFAGHGIMMMIRMIVIMAVIMSMLVNMQLLFNEFRVLGRFT